MPPKLLPCLFIFIATFLIDGRKIGIDRDGQPTQEEVRLYNLIIAYRAEKGLAPIPLSPSLTIVAQTHVRDLALNRPDTGKCNAHSWSDKGKWRPCCYTPDHAQKEYMWSKPEELTSYSGNGYEIATSGYNNISAKEALESWKGSPHHNDVILNQGIWDTKWNAIGIGIYQQYAVVWFGHEADRELK